MNKDKKTNTNNYVRISNTFISKKIFHRDNNPCSTNRNNYTNNNAINQNNIFNYLNNDNNSNSSRGKIYIISDDSLCNNNNIESYQITNEYYISSKDNNFRNLFCSPRNKNNDESITFKENISENIASYDINHRIKKINISPKENQLRDTFHNNSLYSNNSDFLFNKNIRNKNTTFRNTNYITNNKNSIKKKIIDYNKLKNSFNNSDNFINNSHCINSTNYLNNSLLFNNSERKTEKNSGITGITTVFHHYSEQKNLLIIIRETLVH